MTCAPNPSEGRHVSPSVEKSPPGTTFVDGAGRDCTAAGGGGGGGGGFVAGVDCDGFDGSGVVSRFGVDDDFGLLDFEPEDFVELLGFSVVGGGIGGSSLMSGSGSTGSGVAAGLALGGGVEGAGSDGDEAIMKVTSVTAAATATKRPIAASSTRLRSLGRSGAWPVPKRARQRATGIADWRGRSTEPGRGPSRR